MGQNRPPTAELSTEFRNVIYVWITFAIKLLTYSYQSSFLNLFQMANNDQADLESISSQLRGICISNDDTIQHLDSVHVSEHADVNQDGALFTPSKPILNTVCDSTGLSLLSTSPLEAAAFSTPQSDLKECCKDATCSVCLSPLLCRTALVETRCKVRGIANLLHKPN